MAKSTGGPGRSDRTLAASVWNSLWLTRGLMDQLAAEQLANGPFAVDVTMSQFRALVAVRMLAPCGVAELAQRVQTTTASMSTMVDRLVDMKLLTRARSKHDRRRVEIQLARGMDTRMKKVEEAIYSGLAGFFAQLDASEKKALRTVAEAQNRILPDLLSASGYEE
ncbi:MAG: MarR family transcriptional regulator [Phycisphaerales bacterium]|nr:MarR family transcriptional regulator [Phycisphaerales bacterium]